MIIIGAKGLAKEVLEVCKNTNQLKGLVFYDNVNLDKDMMYGKFPIFHDEATVSNYFDKEDDRFTLGMGAIEHRIKLSNRFTDLGGKFTSLISPQAMVSTYDVNLAEGIVIMPGATISNGVSIGRGCLVYFNAIITHDVSIGDHSIVSPGATLLGRSTIGQQCFIGANATILPDVVVGDNVIVGAGAIVTKDIESNTTVVGIPARKI